MHYIKSGITQKIEILSKMGTIKGCWSKYISFYYFKDLVEYNACLII